MAFEFLKKAGAEVVKKTGEAVKYTVEARERRFNDPAFQAELAIERSKTADALLNMGAKTFKAAGSAILNVPLRPLFNIAKAMSDDTYTKKDALIDSLKGFGTATWDCTKLLASVLVAGGRTTKLGLRYLTAL